MSQPSTTLPTSKRPARLVWTVTLFLVAIGLIAAVRRTYVLLSPPEYPRFAAGAALDAPFAAHRSLTLLHILPAALLILLMPLQFVSRIRTRHLTWHRWSGRLLIVLGFIVGTSALAMSYTTPIGGANETAATTLFAILFLLFLALGFWNIRQRNVVRHREWMIRAFGVALGVATTRPIVAAFFAARRLPPHEFFGTAFWLGFTLTLLAAETWIHYSASQYQPNPQLPLTPRE
jgi:hypothetical protein